MTTPAAETRIDGRPYVAEDRTSEGQMQAIIVRWCDLIGVTNEGSIQVATGVVSGGAALFRCLRRIRDRGDNPRLHQRGNTRL
jgi:hypothetical protein